MDNLDQPQNFNAIDKDGMLKHIEELPEQIEQAWKELANFIIPTHYIKIKNVVITGMGGSSMGGSLAKCLAFHSSKVPIEIVKDYTIPEYVNSESLVIVVCYSGETEETYSAFNEAGKRGAKTLAATIGGDIASLASRFKTPVYRINYGSQPRAALGYTFTSVLAIFYKLGLIDLKREDVKETIVLMQGLRTKLTSSVPTYQNDAKKLAQRMVNVIPVIIGSGILTPVAYRWATQLNENSKHFSINVNIPEACHNWINGIDFPIEFKKLFYIFMLQSKYDHPRNRVRQNIIGQLLQKNGIGHEFIFIHPSGSPLSEQMLTIYLGDYASYYLTMLHNIDPTKVEKIEFFKQNLEKIKE